MPVLIDGVSSMFSTLQLALIPALAAVAFYLLAGVPVKIVAETSAIGGNTVGGIVGTIAGIGQGILNAGAAVISSTGVVKLNSFKFAEGAGANYGKQASEAVLQTITNLGGIDVQLSSAIFIFIALFLVLNLFRYLGSVGDRIFYIIQYKEVSVRVTPISAKFSITEPGGTKVAITNKGSNGNNGSNGTLSRLFSSGPFGGLLGQPKRPLLENNRTRQGIRLPTRALLNENTTELSSAAAAPAVAPGAGAPLKLKEKLEQGFSSRRGVLTSGKSRPRINSNLSENHWTGGEKRENNAKKLAYEAMVEKAAANFLRSTELSDENM
jgi:hypothetical protein